MADAQIIRFPVERRQAAVAGAAVAGTSGAPPDITMTVPAQAATAGSPPWWSKIPPITSESGDRRAWMKLGPLPALRAKRHRVIAVQVEGTSPPQMMALTACGRHMVIGAQFGDPWSGGDCRTCRSKGWT